MTDADPPILIPDDAAPPEADRARRKAIRAASQPFFAIGVSSMAAAVALGILGLAMHSAADAVLAVPFFIIIGGLAHGVAALRSARYIRRHPPIGRR
ncbi:MAG TPA: hypothetical protein VL358_11565 [Caulobacteraceae bacterium]|jgi:hypothetical protein|nr:hypothetical protein [Caulobacteraceae bacterium]